MNHRFAGLALFILGLACLLPAQIRASPPADAVAAIMGEAQESSPASAQSEEAEGDGCWSVADLVTSPMTPAQPRAGGGLCACSQGCCSGCSCPEDAGTCCARVLGQYCVAEALCTCGICAIDPAG
jgi:hypothetical protein